MSASVLAIAFSFDVKINLLFALTFPLTTEQIDSFKLVRKVFRRKEGGEPRTKIFLKSQK